MSRKYRRLSPGEGAELLRLHRTGGFTITDLADRFGLSYRGCQESLKRLAAKHGGEAARCSPSPIVITSATPPIPTSAADLEMQAVYDAAFSHACRLEAIAMAHVQKAAESGGIAALRAVELAASALSKITALKKASVGAPAVNPVGNVEAALPELPIRVLTEDEVAAIRQAQMDEDAARGITFGDGEVDEDEIVEGEDDDDAQGARMP